MNKEQQERVKAIVTKAREVSERVASNVYVHKWGEVSSGYYDGRGCPTGIRVRDAGENPASIDWQAVSVRVHELLTEEGK